MQIELQIWMTGEAPVASAFFWEATLYLGSAQSKPRLAIRVMKLNLGQLQLQRQSHFNPAFTSRVADIMTKPLGVALALFERVKGKLRIGFKHLPKLEGSVRILC
ncbi:hypothetical protein PIB30_052966 [Stylosanthes scabra]|uniref:Uncharacterized protein n=1 Tax=Stylosanthes scabra TaxID=79078 RepID=A0ABU6SIL6_9FABA|nr:hypothetical protein [Stylosanthes scabra]